VAHPLVPMIGPASQIYRREGGVEFFFRGSRRLVLQGWGRRREPVGKGGVGRDRDFGGAVVGTVGDVDSNHCFPIWLCRMLWGTAQPNTFFFYTQSWI
jgi:hypothetical protein